MKVVWFIALVAVVIAALLFLAGQLGWLKGTQPSDLGVKDGRLKPPAHTPNSVSSQADLYPNHPQAQYAAIAPLDYQGDAKAAMAKLVGVLQAQSGTVIVSQTDDYLYAQSTTQLLRFTDDVEFWLDAAQQKIQVRSASRIGRKDFGVNRQRIEAIRAQLNTN
ncbi:MAG: hypothetical protein A3E00_14105 [Curvibacter sp. RIFCSPHIGHO2_12_FULL_63_18]|uniref:DUF1499 domain-containing protein n=1 Tax=Rhodoferax sp. TaxID=50421 RepID=UPI0008AE95CB|nr:DUF1499 domain-containing protein [Rhodoferax sp.]OGO94886.1 MAG: hypothetical protein A2037_11615 [Curvibacter sp. GWA2_63_95]OGP01329.1 MAG: hypothetical protein A3E00_14105 [Curvibacter sp. RIFCSPHIGHO2_12_FULL_63_18]HCX82205.1 DUF1499 domain-containing protein [Rhodoferax sp.]